MTFERRADEIGITQRYGEGQQMSQAVKTVQLPVKNDLGFFEIRMESIGGLGANVAGKILTEAGILRMGLNGAGFASYGSE